MGFRVIQTGVSYPSADLYSSGMYGPVPVGLCTSVIHGRLCVCTSVTYESKAG